MTDQLPNQVRKAFEALDVRYDAYDLEDGVGRLHRRARARRTRRIATSAMLAVVILGAGLVMTRSPRGSDVTLADGTRCTPLDAQSHVTLVREDTGSVVLRVDTGRVRFAVTKQHGRRFEVQAGQVTIHVVGTVFEVARDGDGARVTVQEGRVEVTRAGQETASVSASESWPPIVRGSDTPEPGPAPDESAAQNGGSSDGLAPVVSQAPHGTVGKHAPAHGGSRSGETASASMGNAGKTAWRALARSGDYQRAYVALKSKDSEEPHDSAEDLFLAADSARLSGHPADAVQYLAAIMDRHARDARADLAAFTLGRIYLESLNEPAKAARTFAAARALAPRGELAEDALAREVESLRRAGDGAKARERARTYLEAYPGGQRAESMRAIVSAP